MTRKKYTRRNTNERLRLGKKRKNSQKWRRPKGKDNKMRDRRKNRQKRPEMGSKKSKSEQGNIRGKVPIIIKTLKDLKKATKNNVLILGKVGAKAKINLAKEAKKINLDFVNLDIFKFLKEENEPENKEKTSR